jgi:hypothetical protein
MGIFHQNGSYSKVLVDCGVRVQALVVWGTIQKNSGSLGG